MRARLRSAQYPRLADQRPYLLAREELLILAPTLETVPTPVGESPKRHAPRPSEPAQRCANTTLSL
jgi:hypothetical protein